MEATVENLIDRSGGVQALADAARVWPGTVRSWKVKGIPDRYWHFLIDLGGATADELLAANQKVRDLSLDPRPLGERQNRVTAA